MIALPGWPLDGRCAPLPFGELAGPPWGDSQGFTYVTTLITIGERQYQPLRIHQQP